MADVKMSDLTTDQLGAWSHMAAEDATHPGKDFSHYMEH